MDIAPSRNRILLALLPLAVAAPAAVAGEPRPAAPPPAESAPPPPPGSPFRDEIAFLSRHPSEAVRRACERMQQGQGTLTQVWQVEARWLAAELNREHRAAARRALLERLLINLRHRQMLLLASSHYDPEDRTLAELTAERKAVEAALAALPKDEDRCPDTPDSAEAPPADAQALPPDAPGGADVPPEPTEPSAPPPSAAPPLGGSCGKAPCAETLPRHPAVRHRCLTASSPQEPAMTPAFSPLRTSSPSVGKPSPEPTFRGGLGALLTV